MDFLQGRQLLRTKAIVERMKKAGKKQLLDLYCLAAGRRPLAERILTDITDFYRGQKGGFLPCLAPYNNLDHALAAALAGGRIIDGCRKGGEIEIDSGVALTVLAACLLHDIGMLRREDDPPGTTEGALTFRHVQRGVDFGGRYLRSLGLEESAVAGVTFAIATTALYKEAAPPGPARPEDMHVAAIVTSADLLAQASHPDIITAMSHLWTELEAAYGAESPEYLKTIGAPSFKGYQDLLLNILAFFDGVLLPKLEEAGGFHRFLEQHFGCRDHFYERAIKKNCEILAQNRSILLEVATRLLSARSVTELKNAALPHLRRLLRAEVVLVAVEGVVLLDAKEKDPGLGAAFNGLDNNRLTGLAGTLLLANLEDLKQLGDGTPPSFIAAMYQVLRQGAVLLRTLHDRESGASGVIALLSPAESRSFQNHTLRLLKDLEPAVFTAVRAVAKTTPRSATRTRERLKRSLVAGGRIDAATFEQGVEKSLRAETPLPLILEELAGLKQEEVSRALAEAAGYDFVHLDPSTAVGLADCLQGISPKFCHKHHIVPFTASGNAVQVAAADPVFQDVRELLRGLGRGREIVLRIATPKDITDFIRAAFRLDGSGLLDGELLRPAELESLAAKAAHDETPAQDSGTRQVSADDNIIVRLAEKILLDAIQLHGSDIHVEYHPRRGRGRVRIRVDGRMKRHLDLRRRYLRPLAARYKVLAGLDIAERRLPQDGRMRLQHQGGPIDVRIVTMPRSDGFEDLVLRILRQDSVTSVKDLSFSKENLATWKRVLTAPHGLIVVCGPTGSGKTTTIHASIDHIKDDAVKIWTAEDPVEIVQDGISQVQVAPSRAFGFSEALKAFLRADPDVIFVGEIRDRETAKTAVHAALTGHLVLSTLHSGTAVDTLVRLSHTGINGLDLSESLRCALAQRLVRRLCPHCAVPASPAADTTAARRGQEAGPAKLSQASAAGCPSCHGSGYRGRLPIHELFEPTVEIRPFIRELDLEAIRAHLNRTGWPTMLDDGLEKAGQGLIALESLRALQEKGTESGYN